MPASLNGRNVTPLEPGTFNGVVFVPKEFFIEGETEEQAIERYMDSFDDAQEINTAKR